ncbi:hypothetical protein [Paenibacillus sp. NPDC093718]|uniref:hypothetical protein n=1 Tax=Paenibacillus sp. NPDC093718 TaxID=3390601 RepID=UPI003D07AAF1
MKFKSLLALALSSTMVFSLGIKNVSASESVPEPDTKIVTKELFTHDGVSMGYVTINKTIEYNNTDEGVEFTVTKESDYTLNSEFASLEEYNNKFVDGVDINTYLITKDQELYANGEHLEISSVSTMDSGGIPTISHYYDDGRYKNYTFGSYSDIRLQWTMDIKPDGSNTSGTIDSSITSNTAKFLLAKSAVDSFENNYNDYNLAVKATMVALGVTAISWASLVGLIGSGTAAGFAAAEAVDSYNDAKSDVGNAYNYINMF